MINKKKNKQIQKSKINNIFYIKKNKKKFLIN